MRRRFRLPFDILEGQARRLFSGAAKATISHPVSAVGAPSLTILSWSLDAGEWEYGQHKRIVPFAQRAPLIADAVAATGADVVFLQNSSTAFAAPVAAGGIGLSARHGEAYEWIDNRQTLIAPYGSLQAFLRRGGLWRASVAVNLPFLAVRLTHRIYTQCSYLVANVDVSHIGAQSRQQARTTAIDYMTEIAKADILVGNLALRLNEALEGYSDAWVETGSSRETRATQYMVSRLRADQSDGASATTGGDGNRRGAHPFVSKPGIPDPTAYLEGQTTAAAPTDSLYLHTNRASRILYLASLRVDCARFTTVEPTTVTADAAVDVDATEADIAAAGKVALSDRRALLATLHFPPPSL